MKKLIIAVMISAASIAATYGAAGIYDSFAIVNTTSTTYYDAGASTGNPDFNGAFLGNFTVASDNLKLGGQTKLWKNNGTDVTAADIFYQVRPVASVIVSFSSLSYIWQADLGGNDYRWGTETKASPDNYTANLLTGLTNGDYYLDVYTRITTNGFDAATYIYANNGTNNYTATFTVVPEPATWALLAGGLTTLMVIRRRRIG